MTQVTLHPSGAQQRSDTGTGLQAKTGGGDDQITSYSPLCLNMLNLDISLCLKLSACRRVYVFM